MKRDGFNTRGKFGEHTESFIVKDVAGYRHLTATKTGLERSPELDTNLTYADPR